MRQCSTGMASPSAPMGTDGPVVAYIGTERNLTITGASRMTTLKASWYHISAWSLVDIDRR